MMVVVVGATGVLGQNVVPRLVEREHAVRAVVRREDQAEMFRRLGVEPIIGDILKVDTLLQATAACDAVLHLATAIPKPGGARDWSLNDRIRREGTQNLLAATDRNGVRRYIQQSIMLLYGDRGTHIVDELAPLRPAAHLQSAADMEAFVQATPLEWCILRGGLFYGPGSGWDEGWRVEAQAGRLRLPGEGHDLISLIHVVDMARAVVQAVEHAPASSIYNVVDDEPVSYRTLYHYVAARVGGPEPEPGGPTSLPSLGCSNARIKSEIGWSPAYPTFRSGLAD